MVGRVIKHDIVNDAMPAEIAVLDYRFDTLYPKSEAKQILTISFVNGQKIRLV